MISEIKNEVLSLVQSIEDENLLQLLKADIEFFKERGNDIMDGLTKKHFIQSQLFNVNISKPDRRACMFSL